MKMDNSIYRQAQRGLSLIELMVALLLSSLLILGVTQIYIDNKRNYAFQQGQSDSLENARYAMMLLETELFRAGYKTLPGDHSAFPRTTDGDCSFQPGETINFDTEDQRICLRYQPALPEVTTCDGELVTGASNPYDPNVTPVIVELQIADNSLFCNGAPLVENMVDIRFSFGVSQDETSKEAFLFTDDPDLDPSAGEYIRSVRYAVLLKSRSENLADSNNNLVYRDWRSKWYGENNTSAPDRALYYSLENTVAIRN